MINLTSTWSRLFDWVVSFVCRFTVRAVVDGKPYPDGVGKNKKEAKLNAAANALTVLLEETIDPVRLLWILAIQSIEK